MAKKALKNKQERQAKFKVRGTRAAGGAAVLEPCTSGSCSAASASELAHAGELPGVTKASW